MPWQHAGSILRPLLWPSVVLAALVFAKICLEPLGPDAAMIASGLFSAALIYVLELAVPFAKEWNEDDGEVKTDATFVVVLAAVDDVTRSVITFACSRWLYGDSALNLGSSALKDWWLTQHMAIKVTTALVVGELGGWFSHWLLHVRSLPFWRLHRVHHAVTRLWILNTYRFHPLDLAMQLVCIHPLLHLVGLNDEMVLFWYTVWFNVVGQLSHCNINTKCGVLNFLFNTPEVHRYHHSRERPVSNSNYGQVLIVWDLVFGTFHFNFGGKGTAKGPPVTIGDKFLSGSGVWRNLKLPLQEIMRCRRRG